MAIDFAGDARGVQLQLLIERAKYERWLASEVRALLDREFAKVVDTILSPSFRSLSQFEQARKLDLFRELDRQMRAMYGDVTNLETRELAKYSDAEQLIAREEAMAGVPDALGVRFGAFLPKTTLRAIAELPIQGLTLGDWFTAQANSMSVNVRRIIQNGLVEGKGMAEISRRIVADTRTLEPVLSRRAVNEARIITRTATTAVHNAAAFESYQSLPPGVSNSYRYVAVLDNRTSEICRELDGNVYRYDDPNRVLPPQHLNCRSTTLPILRGGEATVTEQRDQPLTLRSYASWLNGQSTNTQDDVLGARASAVRNGSMSLADAISSDTRTLTLAQFVKRIGLTPARATAIAL
jgi:SPP1 gp7 family putative phage head morphogenesis protein